MKNAIIITMAISLLAFSGCMVIWSDEVFIGTLFKTVDANDLNIIAEPNYIQIGSGQSKSDNDNIKVTTPYGVVETIKPE